MHQTFLTLGRRILSSAVISITGRLHHKRANILQASEIFPKIGNFRKRSFHLGKRSENLRESGQLLRPRMVLLWKSQEAVKLPLLFPYYFPGPLTRGGGRGSCWTLHFLAQVRFDNFLGQGLSKILWLSAWLTHVILFLSNPFAALPDCLTYPNVLKAVTQRSLRSTSVTITQP